MKSALSALGALSCSFVSLTSVAFAQVPSADVVSCRNEGGALNEKSPPLLRFDAAEDVAPQVNLSSAPGAFEPIVPAVFPCERLDPASQGRVTIYEVLACEGRMPRWPRRARAPAVGWMARGIFRDS